MMLLMLLTTVSAWAQFCALTLDDNYDGGGSRTLPPIEKGSKINLTTLAPTRTGYTFYGWSENPKGFVDYQPTSTITVDSDMTLYAVWENRIINGMKFEYDLDNSESVILVGVSGDLAKNVVIPSSVTIEGKDYTVTSISNGAFATCMMESVTIPASVTRIGDHAFYSCKNLTSVTIYATAVPELGFSVFDATPAKIYVYSYLVDSYKNTENWMDYADKTEAITPVASGTCGKQDVNEGKDVRWEVVEAADNNSLIIRGTGAMEEYKTDNQPWKDYKSDITTVVIGDGVTSIDKSAFDGCTQLATITLYSNPLIAPNAFPPSTTVKMNLTSNEALWNWWMTFYNKNYSFTVDGNTTIYKGKVNGNSVQLTEVADIPAGNAAILKSTSSSITLTLTKTTSADFTDNDLKGTDLDTDASSMTYAYCLANGANGVGFYKYTGNGVNEIIPANRAYLIIPGSNNAPAYNFLGFEEDNEDATSLSEELRMKSEESLVYDLSGRRVDSKFKNQNSKLEDSSLFTLHSSLFILHLKGAYTS